jgi:flagellar biogenesis protein FliO
MLTVLITLPDMFDMSEAASELYTLGGMVISVVFIVAVGFLFLRIMKKV